MSGTTDWITVGAEVVGAGLVAGSLEVGPVAGAVGAGLVAGALEVGPVAGAVGAGLA